MAEELKTKIKNCDEAITAFSNSIREEKLTDAEVAIAKESLIRSYETGHLTARQVYDRITTEKL